MDHMSFTNTSSLPDMSISGRNMSGYDKSLGIPWIPSSEVEPESTGYIVVKVFLSVLYTCVFVLGLCGNTLVIYVVCRFSKMQTVTNLYILNLAVADECFLIGVPIIISAMYVQWPFGFWVCRIFMTLTGINQITSSIFLTVMSADRYIAVCHAISAPKWRTPLISRIVSLTVWMASTLLVAPIFLYSNVVVDPEGGAPTCNVFWPDTSFFLNGEAAFITYTFTLGFAVPLALILCFYILVVVKLRTVGPRNKSKQRRRDHQKVTRLVLTVVAVYVFCWLPYWLTQLALLNSNSAHTPLIITIFTFAAALAYSNSAMNPILYAFLSDNFKKSFTKACRCQTSVRSNNYNGDYGGQPMTTNYIGRTRDTSFMSRRPTGVGLDNIPLQLQQSAAATMAATSAQRQQDQQQFLGSNSLTVPNIPPSVAEAEEIIEMNGSCTQLDYSDNSQK